MPRSRRARMWARKAFAAPALSVRMRMSVPCRWASGIWARAWSRTVMWSAAVLAPALPGPQQAGQGLAGVVQEAQQRVEAEAALVGGCGLLLLGVAGDQRGVDVQDQAGQVASAGPGRGYAARGSRRPAARRPPGPRPGPRAARPVRRRRCRPAAARRSASEATGPNTSRWSRSTARSAIASPPSASITARSTAIRPGSCPVPRGRSLAQRVGERAGQPGGIGEIGQQPGPGMADHPATVGRDDEAWDATR